MAFKVKQSKAVAAAIPIVISYGVRNHSERKCASRGQTWHCYIQSCYGGNEQRSNCVTVALLIIVPQTCCVDWLPRLRRLSANVPLLAAFVEVHRYLAAWDGLIKLKTPCKIPLID